MFIGMHVRMLILFMLLILLICWNAYIAHIACLACVALVFIGNGKSEKYVPRIGSLNVQGGARDGRVKRRLEVRTSQG